MIDCLAEFALPISNGLGIKLRINSQDYSELKQSNYDLEEYFEVKKSIVMYTFTITLYNKSDELMRMVNFIN